MPLHRFPTLLLAFVLLLAGCLQSAPGDDASKTELPPAPTDPSDPAVGNETPNATLVVDQGRNFTRMNESYTLSVWGHGDVLLGGQNWICFFSKQGVWVRNLTAEATWSPATPLSQNIQLNVRLPENVLNATEGESSLSVSLAEVWHPGSPGGNLTGPCLSVYVNPVSNSTRIIYQDDIRVVVRMEVYGPPLSGHVEGLPPEQDRASGSTN